MPEIPKDNRLLTFEPSQKGVNMFEDRGIMPRNNEASIGKGTNDTAPFVSKGFSSNSPKKGFNELC